MKKTVLLLLSLIAISFLIIATKDFLFNLKNEMLIESLEEVTNCVNDDKENQQESKKTFENGILGMLVIPKLEIEAPIKEGTNSQVLKYTIRTF